VERGTSGTTLWQLDDDEDDITYSECVIEALGIQHAKRMCQLYYRLWTVRLYLIFPHSPINDTIF